MNDAAISFALIALLALGWPVALAWWWEARKRGDDLDDIMTANTSLCAEIEELQSEVLSLRIALNQASKNDHRDNKGRFAKAS